MVSRRVSPRSTYQPDTILWKTRGLCVFVRKPPRSGIRTAFSLSTVGRIFGCKSTFPFPFLCPMIMADVTSDILCFIYAAALEAGM